MASLLQKHYGLWHHDFSSRDLLRYVCIAVVALLGIAGLLQSISGSANTNVQTKQNSYGNGVYTNQIKK